jgi:hypothetical protein
VSDFDPDQITQDQLHRYRDAAEAAWGDDTRHPSYVGHPLAAAGQCYVTSRWLADKLGGHVAVKGGHYFMLTPDKQYVVDLTGDQFAYPPEDLTKHGIRLDEDDDGWKPTDDQTKWTPGPILYKPASHPLYKGGRIKTPKTENPRVKLFKQRANEALDS